jgi:hypothetical protein
LKRTGFMVVQKKNEKRIDKGHPPLTAQ